MSARCRFGGILIAVYPAPCGAWANWPQAHCRTGGAASISSPPDARTQAAALALIATESSATASLSFRGSDGIPLEISTHDVDPCALPRCSAVANVSLILRTAPLLG